MQRREVRTVDLRGLAGPVAVAKAASIVREMQRGETIVIVATGSRSLTDFRAWCGWTGNEVVGWSADGGAFGSPSPREVMVIMAVVLLVEDWPDLGIFEAEVLQAQGHTVLRCSGGPSPFAGCPLFRGDACRLADACDVIVVSGWPSMPLRHRTYRERDLIRAYRRHPAYGRKPMLVVSYEPVECTDGSGPMARIEKDASPAKVLGAVEALLSHGRLSHHSPLADANRRR